VKIDTHIHALPERSIALLRRDPVYRVTLDGMKWHGGNYPDFTITEKWFDPDVAVAGMKQNGVDIGIISAAPKPLFYYEVDLEPAVAMCRETNLGLAEYQQAKPQNFRWMAHLPLRFPKAVHLRALAHVQDYLPMSARDIVNFEGCEVAWKKAHERAGTSLSDLSFVETHDCFTIAELLEYEAMGLAPKGQGRRAIAEGWTQKDGKLPVNPSGGLKSKGHPIGATGVSMHVMAALQLEGKAEGMQVKDAKLAGIFNMGGAAVANYVSILERLR